jgi:hypothetical protein
MRSYHRFLFCFAALVLLIFVGSNAAYAQRTYNRQWNVYPQWARGAIQAVIDNARDGDVIYFNRGTYDFSAAPPNYPFQNGGALQIIDKSLIIRGAFGSIFVGAPVVIEPDTGWMRGIVCFKIMNSDVNKDVTFDGLTFRTFMIGIGAIRTNEDPYNPVYYSNLRSVVVKNCTFMDMKRHGVAFAGVQGNITISNNRIFGDTASSMFGIYLDWLYEPGKLEWQPEYTLVTVTNNSISNFNSSGIISNRLSRTLITGNAISNSLRGITFNNGLKKEATVSNNALSDLDDGIDIYTGTVPVNGVPFQVVAQGMRLTYNNFSNIRSIGIFIDGDLFHTNFIAYNKINMTNNSGWGPAIRTQGSYDQYINNILRGYGFPAIALSGFDDSANTGIIWGANHEYFMGNSVSGFTSLMDPSNPENIGWHYDLDGYTHDNVVIGIRNENATYMDYGVNNIFKFVYPYFSLSMTTSLMSSTSPKVQQKPKKDAVTI